jgi:hypothetical protein
MGKTAELDAEALGRARGGQSFSNYPPIFREFMARGIPEEQIKPRENVLTYRAWRALGRQVKKGEHGVRVTTWIPTEEKEKGAAMDGSAVERKVSRLRPKNAVVFHVSQTKERGK